MKILEIFKNPMKKLSPNEKEEFYRITNSENTKRLFWVNIIIALVTFIPVISILVFQSKGQWIDTPVYTYYLMVYIARIVFCTTIAVISYIFMRSPQKTHRSSRIFIAGLFAVYIILDGSANSIMVQTLQGGITVYVITVLVVSTVLYYPVLFNIVFLALGFVVLSTGIILIQQNSRIIMGDMINALFTTSLGLFISRMIYISKINDFVNHITIKKQARELEYINSILTTRAESHSSQLQNTHDKLHDEERKKISTEKQIRQYHEDLREVFQVSFFYLKVPLEKISSYFDHLINNPEKIAADKESFLLCLDEINKAEHALLLLLDNIGVYMSDTPFAPVDLNYVMEQVLENNSLKIKEKKLDIQLSKLPVIMGDKHQIFRLFQGMIEYIAFAEDDYPHPKIHFNYESSGDKMNFTVQTNKKISVEEANGIFSIEHLLTEGAKRNSVNLTNCKRIIEHHGGEMWLDTDNPQGLRIEFNLPKS
jgi:signal transduction histidine kinase